MTPAELLTDAFGRIAEGACEVVDGLDEDQLAHRPGPDANPIGWLVWHLARVQDDHVAEVAGVEQVWTAQGFADRFALPFAVGELVVGEVGDHGGAALEDAREGVDEELGRSHGADGTTPRRRIVRVRSG